MDQVQRIRGVAGYADGDYKIESYFNDYRDYGSLKLPQNITINRPVRKLVFKLGKPKLNSQIADSVFQ